MTLENIEGEEIATAMGPLSNLQNFIGRVIPGIFFTLLLCGIDSITLGNDRTLPSNSPNILFIYADDLGWRDTGFMGSDFYETPNLDRLAAEGVVFTEAYAAASNCAPSRACLLTGQYTPRHKIYNVGTKPRGKTEYRRLIPVSGTDTLPKRFETWASVLKRSGYTTGIIGKWHLSDDPLDYGFDTNIAGSHSGSPPKGYYPPHPKAPGLQHAEEDEYLTDRLNEEAIRFIEGNQKRPWILFLSHFAVHTPLNAKRELLPKYKSKKAGSLHNHVAMATMIEALDTGIGKVLDCIDKFHLAENTIILFSSDNGGFGPATDMEPLRGYKGTYYEGGIRVPLVIRWPEKIKAGGRCEVPVTGVDLFPTLLQMSGTEIPRGQNLDGRSLVPLITQSISKWDNRSLFWHFPAYLQAYANWSEQRDPLFRSRPCSVIRRGPYKLIYYFEDKQTELFDLASDPGESNDLSKSRIGLKKELLQELRAWWRETEADLPNEPNPRFDINAESAAIEAKLRKSQGR